jgi:hypothetical protein
MLKSLFDKAKDAVKDAAGKVQAQATGVVKLLNAAPVVPGERSYLVQPEQLVLRLRGAPVYAMKCPVENATTTMPGQADIRVLASYLNNRFGNRYLIVNLSDGPYDYGLFRGEVQVGRSVAFGRSLSWWLTDLVGPAALCATDVC